MKGCFFNWSPRSCTLSVTSQKISAENHKGYTYNQTDPKMLFYFLGAIKVDYTEKDVCIGNYPLSAALTCAKVCSAFEEAWGVF